MKKTITILACLIPVLGASASWQGQTNRRNEDVALYRMYRSDAELAMFKKQNRLKHKKYKQAKRKTVQDIAWSQADANLFAHEQDMYNRGIRVGSYDWDDGEEVKTGITYNKRSAR